jgi:hypothetical protein
MTSKKPTLPWHNNLTSSSRTLLRLHHHFGHHSFTDIQTWAQEGHFNIPIKVSRCTIPTCLACEFGKATKQPHAAVTDQLGLESTEPGNFVSVDTMEAGIPGQNPYL